MCSNCRDYEGPYEDPHDDIDFQDWLEYQEARKSALTQLREALEQIRLNANRINKATWLWRNDGQN